MTTDNANRLELTGVRQDMTDEEAYQALLAALKRQGLKVYGAEAKKPEKST
jgi:hypothetical protein